MKKHILIQSFITLGICFLLARCDNTPSTTPSPLPGPPDNALPTFTYKGAVVGSSGNMDINLKPGNPGDTTKKGEGSMTLTLDGKPYTMSSEEVAEWDHGTELKDAMFSTPSGDATASVSVDKDGENPEIDLTVNDHEGIKAEVLNGGDDVSVYEGSYEVTYEDTGERQSLETFNMVIKGDEFIIMTKTSESNEKICLSEQASIQLEVGVFSGTVTRNGDDITLVLNNPKGSDHPVHGDNVRSVTLTKSGDEYTGEAVVSGKDGETTSLTSCRGKGEKTLVLDDRKGYEVEVEDDNGKFTVIGFEFAEDGTPLDKDGNLIADNDPDYYTMGYPDEEIVPVKTSLLLKKTL